MASLEEAAVATLNRSLSTLVGAPCRVLAIHTLLKDRFLKLGENADSFICTRSWASVQTTRETVVLPRLTRPVGGREQCASMHSRVFGLHAQVCMFFTGFEVKQARSPFSL